MGEKEEKSTGFYRIVDVLKEEMDDLSPLETDGLIWLLRDNRKAEFIILRIYPSMKIHYEWSIKWTLKRFLDRFGGSFREKKEFVKNNLCSDFGVASWREFCVVRFDQEVNMDYAVAVMAENGLRQATIKELLQFLVEHPDRMNSLKSAWINGHESIIALGSSWKNKRGFEVVPLVQRVTAILYLSTRSVDSNFNTDCKFLAVNKK